MEKKYLKHLLVLTTFALGGCSEIIEGQNTATITGNVFYLQRIALPDTATLTVTLSDVSLADKKSEVISQHSYITQGKQVPLPFSLNYALSDIKKGHTYNISAKVEIQNELVFVSDSAHHLIDDPKQANNYKIKLVSVK